MQKREIEQFYKDVTRLDLRFPTAEIAAKTGYSKGNVSEYLRRIKEPGKKFLISFYEAFGSSLNVPRELEKAEVQEDQRQRRKNTW